MDDKTYKNLLSNNYSSNSWSNDWFSPKLITIYNEEISDKKINVFKSI